MDLIDFSNQFTNSKFSKSFRIENRGKRAQTITWEYIKRKEIVVHDENNPLDANEDTENIMDDADDTQSEMSLGGKSFASIGSTAMMMSALSGANKYKINIEE